jgi:hypothetical protein
MHLKKFPLILGLAVVLLAVFVALGSVPREVIVSDDSPAYNLALSKAIRALDGAGQSTLNPTRVGLAQANPIPFTTQPGGPTCDGSVTCEAWPTYVPLTCDPADPECTYPAGAITLDPLKCDPRAPTWDGAVTCHVGSADCTQPTMHMYRTCDARQTCDGSFTCNGQFTHWNSTCQQIGYTCDGSPTCVFGQPGAGPFTCTHFTVDGTPTCNGVPTCKNTCDQWFTCHFSSPGCAPTPSKKTSWGTVKGQYRK